MAERLKAQHWKCCLGVTLTRVRIPLSPFIRILVKLNPCGNGCGNGWGNGCNGCGSGWGNGCNGCSGCGSGWGNGCSGWGNGCAADVCLIQTEELKIDAVGISCASYQKQLIPLLLLSNSLILLSGSIMINLS